MPAVYGILNVTPDSFSDGGRAATTAAAIDRGLALLDEGADALDVGGESTRPGAAPVSEHDERSRVVPVIAGLLRARPDLVISIDTAKAGVAQAALDVGAAVVNDVTGLRDPAMRRVCAAAGVPVVLMHMRGTPQTMAGHAVYGDVVAEVHAELAERCAVACADGVRPERLAVDPGIGFAKELDHNLAILRSVARFRDLGPVWIGASRKRFIGALTGVDAPAERLGGSVGAALAAARAGAAVLRVHDVAATRQALTVFAACGGLAP